MTSSAPIRHERHRAAWADAAQPTRRIGGRVEHHARIGSTNDRAWSLLEQGELGVAVVADLQTAGRGRRDRTWVSPPGRNLMVSVGFEPRVAARNAWWLSIAAALAVRAGCRPQANLALRWPNDIVAVDGRKVAGVLVETRLESDGVAAAVIGIGINVDWPRDDDELPDELRGRAASLTALSGAGVDRVALLRRLLDALDREVAAIVAGRSPLERYRAASWLDGRQVSVALPDGEVSGTVTGIGDDGSLLLGRPAGSLAVAMGEVVRVAASPAGSAPRAEGD